MWTASSTIRLDDGVSIPRLGLGVFRSNPGEETFRAVKEALRLGYRHIDTAAGYRNEADVGRAIRESGLPRDQIFVTTKLWNADQGYDSALSAFDRSQAALGLGAVDLYLLHWPVTGKRLDSWRALERLYEEKRVRAIGVSNFLVPHLNELLARAQVKPSVNQIELSPFLRQHDVVAACSKENIAIEAYSPLTKGRRLDHPAVVAAARISGKTPAQVLIRWSLQHGFIVLPKSVRPERIRENVSVFDFELDADTMARLDALDEDLHTGWDPTGVP